MGGVGMGTAAAATQVGLEAKSLIDASRVAKQKQRHLKNEYVRNAKSQRNLLDEQLASRRARLGAMGIASSGSEVAVQDKMIEDYHRNQMMEAGKTIEQISKDKLKNRIDRENKIMGLGLGQQRKIV